jgi:K+-transporting ATPase ATPase C chain
MVVMNKRIDPRMQRQAVAATNPAAIGEPGKAAGVPVTTAERSTPARASLATELKQGILFTLVTMVLLGVIYPSVLWAVGRVAFADKAEGSLVRRADGTVVGSRLIAQPFTRPEYFAPRPSGVDYNAASTGGTNYGPSNPDHLKAVGERLAAITAREGVAAQQVPSEMVTASGGGLDPHVPPEAALLQVARVAAARGVAPERVRDLVTRHTEPPTLGFLGRARVNVLELNLALDETLGPPAAAR